MNYESYTIPFFGPTSSCLQGSCCKQRTEEIKSKFRLGLSVQPSHVTPGVFVRSRELEITLRRRVKVKTLVEKTRRRPHPKTREKHLDLQQKLRGGLKPLYFVRLEPFIYTNGMKATTQPIWHMHASILCIDHKWHSNLLVSVKLYFCMWSLTLASVLQISCEKVFRHPKPTPKPLAKGIGARINKWAEVVGHFMS